MRYRLIFKTILVDWLIVVPFSIGGNFNSERVFSLPRVTKYDLITCPRRTDSSVPLRIILPWQPKASHPLHVTNWLPYYFPDILAPRSRGIARCPRLCTSLWASGHTMPTNEKSRGYFILRRRAFIKPTLKSQSSSLLILADVCRELSNIF